jgi:hypothetical protein
MEPKSVEFTMHDAKWDEMVAASKFKTMPDFGKAKQGPHRPPGSR